MKLIRRDGKSDNECRGLPAQVQDVDARGFNLSPCSLASFSKKIQVSEPPKFDCSAASVRDDTCPSNSKSWLLDKKSEFSVFGIQLQLDSTEIMERTSFPLRIESDLRSMRQLRLGSVRERLDTTS